MARGYEKEAERINAFNKCMRPYLKVTISEHVPNRMISSAVTDGCVCLNLPDNEGDVQVPVYIQEVKAEMGIAGDPYFQAQRYYQLFLTNEDLQHLLKHSVLPVLLVELVGPQIRVSLLASHEDIRVVCEPLTPFLHLLSMFASQPAHMDRVARVVRALKRGIVLIKRMWHELGAVVAESEPPRAEDASPTCVVQPAEATSSTRDPSLKLPYPLRPGTGFCNVKLLPPGAWKMVYQAEDEGSGKEVVIKFARLPEQAVHVHRAWAAAGLAPKLEQEVRRLPCGLTMLVMERLRREDGWTMFRSLTRELKQQLSDTVLEKLRAAQTIEVDGAKTVHGDMRQANVLVQLGKDGQPVTPPQARFLDFDWSGLEGQVRMPAFARKRLPKYSVGAKLSQKYDEELWLLEMSQGPL